MLIYLLSKALRQVEGPFHLLVSRQLWFALLPTHRSWFNSNEFFTDLTVSRRDPALRLRPHLLVLLEAPLQDAITSSRRGRRKPARFRRSLTIWPLMETSRAVLEWRLWKYRRLKPRLRLWGRVCVSHLGDMLTSRIQGFRFSSSMISKPNSSWQLYGDSTFIFIRLSTYGSDLKKKEDV